MSSSRIFCTMNVATVLESSLPVSMILSGKRQRTQNSVSNPKNPSRSAA